MAPHKSHDQWNPAYGVIVLPGERDNGDEHPDADERDEQGIEQPTRGSHVSRICSSRTAATMEIPRINRI
jgi:hypothetical protein